MTTSDSLSKETTFPPGRIVYTRDGRQARYIGKVESGHVIERQLTAYRLYGYYEAEELIDGPIEVVDIVYAKAPTAIVDAELALLTERTREAQNILRETEAKVGEALRAQAATIAKLKNHAALRNIEDFLDGKITHFVVIRNDFGNIHIETAEAFLSCGERHNKDQKLLTLYGRSKGDLLWKVNQYYDGSGSWTEVVPCISEDEAKSLATERFLLALENIDLDRLSWYFSDIQKTAAALGIDVPARISERGKSDRLSSLTHALQTKEKEAASLRDEIAKARGEDRSHEGK